MYNDTLKDFLIETKTRVSKMKNFMEDEDASNYAILSHAMKSDSKYLGFKKSKQKDNITLLPNLVVNPLKEALYKFSSSIATSLLLGYFLLECINISTSILLLTLCVLLDDSISITTGYVGLYFFIILINPLASFLASSI